MQSVSGRNVSENAVIAMRGITKVYIGEIVEEALRYREQQAKSTEFLSACNQLDEETPSPSGPLRPSHIYEALRRLDMKNVHKRPKEFRL